MHIFTPGEMERRLGAFRNGLAARLLDAALVHTPDNVYYLSGVPLLSAWGRPMLAAVRAGGEATVIGALIEKENMESCSWMSDIRPYGDQEDVWRTSLDMATDFMRGAQKAPRRVGVEQDLLPIGVYGSLRAAFPEAEFVEIGDLIASIRIVKSPEEIRLLRVGGAVAKIGAGAFLEATAERATETDVASYAVVQMNKALAALYPHGGTSTYAYCQAGDHTMTPHLHPTGRRLRQGDIVGLNVFPVIWGYCMELERTFVLGEPTPDQLRALDAVGEAFEACKAAIRPGVRMSEVDGLGRAVLREHGYEAYIRHGTGHAHGIMIGSAGREEMGELREYNVNFMQPGMVNSVEPGIYIPGLGGFRHSDVMLVTDEGAECLTEFSRDL